MEIFFKKYNFFRNEKEREGVKKRCLEDIKHINELKEEDIIVKSEKEEMKIREDVVIKKSEILQGYLEI